MQTLQARHAAIEQETQELRAWRNSAAMHGLARLLHLLIEEHCADLAFIAPDQLQLKQGALRQLMQLRDALSRDGPYLCPKL